MARSAESVKLRRQEVGREEFLRRAATSIFEGFGRTLRYLFKPIGSMEMVYLPTNLPQTSTKCR